MWEALGFVWLLLTLLAAYDILRRPAEVGDKVVWWLLVLLFPFAGLLLYFIIGRSALQRRTDARPSPE
ncbi:MAG: PLDc_N domain-containing protein [Armatimonadetes bacterium]|nr:PLDc_N domain-containing protein [Armatimonadota bacterium]